MKNILFILLSIFYLSSNAQNYNIGMEVTKNDLEANTYVKDSTASALVIYDYGNAYFDKQTFWLKVENKQKIKILTKDGLNRGERYVRLYKSKNSEEEISNITATTYNLENGQIVKTRLSKDAIFRENNENYTDVKFVMPNVKVGSVIVFSYITSSQFIRKFQPWYFQSDIPVLYSEYNTSIPGNYEYNIKLVGTIPLSSENQEIDYNCIDLGRNGNANCAVTQYIMKDIPAYKEEDFTTTSMNYLSRIEYELSVVRGFDGSVDKITKSWEDVDSEMKADNDFGRQLGKKSLVKNLLPESIVSISDKLEKAKAIHQFVLDNYKWNETYELYDANVKDIVKDKIGNAAEINLLLENLLTREGFQVYPILLSTRANGLATRVYPVITDFNYLILKTTIDGKDYYLDATDPYLSFGELPFRCLNQYGRLFDFKYASYWEDIKVQKFSTRQYRVQLALNEDTKLAGTVDSKISGYPSHGRKRFYNENSSQYIDRVKDSYKYATVNKHEVKTTLKNDYEFKETSEITFEDDFVGDKIYFNPFVLKFFEDNPFKLQERTYPIDFGYKDIYMFTMEVDLKDQLKVVEMPKPTSVALPNKTGSLLFNISEKDGKLAVYFKIKFDKAIYGAEYYEALKRFMSKVIEIQNNSVVVLQKL